MPSKPSAFLLPEPKFLNDGGWSVQAPVNPSECNCSRLQQIQKSAQRASWGNLEHSRSVAGHSDTSIRSIPLVHRSLSLAYELPETHGLSP